MKQPRVRNSRGKWGALLIEACLSLALAAFLLWQIFYALALVMAEQLMWIEAFTLARAQIYGQEQDHCSIAAFWPRGITMKIEKECPQPGQVEMTLSFHKFKFSEAQKIKVSLRLREDK